MTTTADTNKYGYDYNDDKTIPLSKNKTLSWNDLVYLDICV